MKDLFNREVSKDDWIIYGTRKGAEYLNLNIGQVLSVTSAQKMDSKVSLETMRVNVVAGSGSGKKTRKVTLGLRSKFVIVTGMNILSIVDFYK